MVPLRSSLRCVHAIILYLCFVTATKEERTWKHSDGGFSSLAAARHRLARQGDGGPYELFRAHEEFVADVNETVEALKGDLSTVLIHTSGVREDSLIFVTGETNVSTFIDTSRYYNLKVISHLPVRVVTILLPDVLANSTLSRATIGRLEALQTDLTAVNDSLQDGFLTDQQVARALTIVDTVSSFVNNATMTMELVTIEALQKFSSLLQEPLGVNANDSVQDYLTSLNATIMENLPPGGLDELVVVIAHRQFSYPSSFLTQYYQQLLNYSYNAARPVQETLRIVLMPTVNNFSATTTTDNIAPSFYAHSDAVLQNTVALLFNNSMPATSVHTELDLAASQFICSSQFNFSSCIYKMQDTRSQQLPVGFRSRTERVYVIFLIAFATVGAIFGIIVMCVIYEDRVMKSERRMMYEDGDKAMSKKGPGLLTPLEGVRKRGTTTRNSTSSYGTVGNGDFDTTNLLEAEVTRSGVASTL